MCLFLEIFLSYRSYSLFYRSDTSVCIFSAGIARGTQAFADNHCDNRDDKKCNHSEKNQKSTSKGPVITINPNSGPPATLVTVTGNGFDPSSPVVISFQGDTRVTVAWTSIGAFEATFNIPSTSSIGDHC